MSDDRDHDQTPDDTSKPFEQPEDRPGDWDPMGPETTPPDSEAEQAGREEDRQIESGEENPT